TANDQAPGGEESGTSQSLLNVVVVCRRSPQSRLFSNGVCRGRISGTVSGLPGTSGAAADRSAVALENRFVGCCSADALRGAPGLAGGRRPHRGRAPCLAEKVTRE